MYWMAAIGGQWLLRWSVVLLAVVSTVPRLGCLCADGHHKPICERLYLSFLQQPEQASACCCCHHEETTAPADDCCHIATSDNGCRCQLVPEAVVCVTVESTDADSQFVSDWLGGYPGVKLVSVAAATAVQSFDDNSRHRLRSREQLDLLQSLVI